jgi:hypothetical protein
MNVSNVFGREAIGVRVFSWFASGAVAEQSGKPTTECAHYHQLCDPGGRAPIWWEAHRRSNFQG